MDVAAWLRGLGLEKYAPAFRDNDVDGEVLPQLTSDDLLSIGVTSPKGARGRSGALGADGARRHRYGRPGVAVPEPLNVRFGLALGLVVAGAG